MGLVDVNVSATLLMPQEFTAALAALLKKGDAIMNDLTQLKGKMNDLEAKADESNKTLLDLAQKVLDLQKSGNIQADINALAEQAQRILEKQSIAEDQADDALVDPVPETPPVEEPPVGGDGTGNGEVTPLTTENFAGRSSK